MIFTHPHSLRQVKLSAAARGDRSVTLRYPMSKEESAGRIESGVRSMTCMLKLRSREVSAESVDSGER